MAETSNKSRLRGAVAGAMAGASTGNPYIVAAGGLIGLITGDGSATPEELAAMSPEEIQALKIETAKAHGLDLNDPAIKQDIQITSSYDDILSNPLVAQAQNESLRAYDDIISGGGLTDMDKLNSERAITEANRTASIQGQDIQSDMARRGLGGSGMELAQKLAVSQGAANRAADMKKDQLAQAQMRALEAISRKGTMAGQMRNDAANYKDAAAKYNADNMMQGLAWKQQANMANAAQENRNRRFNSDLEMDARGFNRSSTAYNNKQAQQEAARDRKAVAGAIDAGTKAYSKWNANKDDEDKIP